MYLRIFLSCSSLGGLFCLCGGVGAAAGVTLWAGGPYACGSASRASTNEFVNKRANECQAGLSRQEAKWSVGQGCL